ncbi:MAG: Ig-like domain repeat protein, partial [Bacteriovoracales bacterium]|nr:Ig-like domain repeat protein [Bacteriovoracales bacterium]
GGCSETCTYRFTVDTSPSTNPSGAYGNTDSASQTSGTGTYYLHVQARDEAGNESAVVHVQAVLDNTGATISSMGTPSSGTYGASHNFTFVVSLNDDVTVTGTPRISLTVGSTTRFANFTSMAGNRTLLFRYTIQSGDNDADGIAFASNSIDLNGGTIRDSANNDTSLTLSSTIINNVKVDTTPPTLTGLSDDSIYKRSKSWSWGCSETCTYRFTVDTSPSTNPSGSYGNANSASQSSGTGTYYLHVQARDEAGNNSAVVHVSAILDNTAPYFSGTPTLSGEPSNTQAPGISWASMTFGDSDSGVDAIQIAIGEDKDNSGALSDTEKSNVLSWTDIPSGPTLNPQTYQIVDGVDGFTLSLPSSATEYYISLRVQDTAGNSSAVRTSSAWQRTFQPSDHSDLVLWFDSGDLATLFTDSTCTTTVASDDDPVACWTDKSGNDNRATQSTSDAIPTYDADTNSVFFDGSNFMNIEDDTNFPYGSTGRSIFILFFRSEQDIQYRFTFSYGVYSSGYGLGVGTLWSFCMFYGSPALGESGCSSINQWEMGGYFFDGTDTGSLYHDGALKQSGDDLSWELSPSSQKIGYLAAPNIDGHWLGNIREIIMFDSTLDTDDRQKVEGYLACKWGLQGRLSSGHPYRTTCPH